MKIRSRLLNKLAAKGLVATLRMLFRTTRIRIHAMDADTVAYEPLPEKFLYPVWHDTLAFPLFCGPIHDMSTLVSQHRDGSLLAFAMESLGVAAVRGSSSRGGARAVRQLIDTADSVHITITPDGPRGPKRELKSGIVFLASHMNRRIVPVGAAASRCWRLRGSWTNLVIPKPWSKVHFVTGKAITIPPKLSKEQLRELTAHVQQQLDATQTCAEQLANGDVNSIAEQIHESPTATRSESQTSLGDFVQRSVNQDRAA